MDKDKQRARLARYRKKIARIEILATDELKQRFKALPNMDGLTNADKLNRLCELWERRQEPETIPQIELEPYNNDVLTDAEVTPELPSLNGIPEPKRKPIVKLRSPIDHYNQILGDDTGTPLYPPAIPDIPLQKYEYKKKLAKVAQVIREQVSDTKNLLRTKEAKAFIKQNSDIEAVKAHNATVAGLIALGHLELDLKAFCKHSEEQQRVILWRLVHGYESYA